MFKSNVLDIDYRDFFQWAKDRFREWKGIYEVAEHYFLNLPYDSLLMLQLASSAK